jgi:L-lactate dehydrogenase complex protein LldE
VKVALFIPCLVDQFSPKVGVSTYRLLKDLGLEVNYPKDQTCCGQPAYNAGHWNIATRLAGHFLTVFRDCEFVVCPSGSCVSMVKNGYATLPLGKEQRKLHEELRGRVYELSEFLGKVMGAPAPGGRFPHRVTYHDSCHLLRVLGVRVEPRRLLRSVEGLELVEMERSEECCGFGGVFSVKHRKLALEVARAKLERAERTGAKYLVACDEGCIMHLRTAARESSSRVEPIHIASVLRPFGDFEGL